MASKKNIQLLLTENVASLGIVGDVVTVKPGYARNYLLPHGLATAPTAGAMKRVEARRAEVEKQLRDERAGREALIARLEGTEISLLRSANEEGHLYGSVTQADIAAALGEEGFEISERDVRIGEPIKFLDSYTIPIQLDQDLRTEIKVWVVSDKASEELQSVDEDEDGGMSSGDQAAPAEASAETEAAGSP
ncbi:MAG: 50S ribosomal protein L9 [Phycisphaerae bacterium]|nr:50S ribosomal protein L9 [Phycisphaerae bacterium]